MINPTAVLGLDNSPAYDNLKQIRVGIETLIKHKARDYDSERKHFKQEQEQDKRERQDLKFVQEKEAKEIIKFQRFMKSKEGGLTAALLGGAAMLGALTLIGSIDIPKMVGDIWNKLKEMFGFSSPAQDQEEVEEATENPPADGDVSAMEPAEQGSGTPLPMPKGVSKGSPIGMRKHPIHGTMKHHNGVDIPAPTGTPLTIRGNGKFISSGFEKGYGNWVVIKDQRGEHFYSHLSKFGKFKAGDSIKTGDVVGYVGTTGTSTGPHLHWEFDTTPGLVGNQRPPSKVMDPYSNGYTYKTPFTGLQTGGAVDKKGKKDQWGINIGPGFTGTSNLTKKTTGGTADKTAAAPYGEKHLVGVMNQGGIKNKNERAMFMAQMAHESGNFKYHTELKPKSYYEGNKNLANLQPGDGLRYLGRGYIQLTGRWNYDDLRKKTGLPLVAKPELAAETNNAGKIALQYWQEPRREPMRAAARKGDVKGATTMINKNHKGLADRTKKFAHYQANPMQKGGSVGKQGGGMVNLASKRIPSPNQNFYDNNFFVRQGRKGKGGVVIVVNNSSGGGSAGGSIHATSSQMTGTESLGVATSTPINYTDISQTYYRYIRGIRS
jgi:murein DD-endopeptidase MepM/ murein hydrolase activator NlpD